MPTTTNEPDDQLNAEILTIEMLLYVDKTTCGNRDKALIVGNSMIAAARLLFARYGVDEQTRTDLYRELWLPLVRDGGGA